MKNQAFWLKFSILNLFLVAVLGTLMRYKIAFSLPQLDQKFLQEAHSHFAFYGWITQVLYVLMLFYLQKYLTIAKLKKYQVLLVLNAIGALLMIPTFIYAGYYWLSIVACSICLFTGFAFFAFLLKDFWKDSSHIVRWFKVGLGLAAFSSLGIFYLSFSKASGLVDQQLYLASSYFYLHFQYNGCFLFVAIGLFLESLKRIGVEISSRESHLIFYPLLFGAVFGFGLSVLWMDLNPLVYWLIVVSALAQTFGAYRLLRLVKLNWSKLVLAYSPLHRFTLWYVGIAFGVKILLQLFSVVPQISQFAFGFRNVVIAYLHLVLLMCISMFLLNQILATNRFFITKRVTRSLQSVLLFVFLNQAVLGLMGVFSVKYIGIPYAAPTLVAISVGISLSVLSLFFSLKARPILKIVPLEDE